MRTLSRMIACSECDKGVKDADMRQVYHLENGQEVVDGIVHTWCEVAFIAGLR